MRIFGYDFSAAKESADIALELKELGRMMNVFDVIIAGVCRANGLHILALDKDFERVKGLKCRVF